MNRKYKSLLDNGSTYGSEFRISHSQKSISVYIKHMWCMNEIMEPTICPVDRIILSKTDAKKNHDISWGYVNTIDEHRRKFAYIKSAAKDMNLTVAKWELVSF